MYVAEQWNSKPKIQLGCFLAKRNAGLNLILRNLGSVALGGDQESAFLTSFPGDSKASHLWATLRNSFVENGVGLNKQWVICTLD